LDELNHNLRIADGVLRFRIFKVDPTSPAIVPPPAMGTSAAAPQRGPRRPEEPAPAAVESQEQEAAPEDGPSAPAVAASEPAEATPEPADAAQEPTEAAAEPAEAAAEPVEAAPEEPASEAPADSGEERPSE
ncbi:MAG TPA: hypothetical protein VF170_09010, partial [Planctomycetaceae bacterium]